jgi:hypothetical protein
VRAISASRTARDVASPAAQLLREPVLGAWRYVLSAPPSIHAFDTAFAEHGGRDSRGCDANEQYVIQSGAVETVLKSQDTLDFVSLNHRGEYIAYRQFRPGAPGIRPVQIVGDGEYRAQIIRWVTPLGREPGVIEVEPANHRADVKGGLYRIEFERRPRDARPVGECCAGYQRPHELSAGRVDERLKTAGERVEQTVACRLIGEIAVD